MGHLKFCYHLKSLPNRSSIDRARLSVPAAERSEVEKQPIPAANALSGPRSVAVPVGPATDSPAIVPNDTTGPIGSVSMEITTESEAEAHAASALSEPRSVAISGGSDTESPPIVPDDATGPIGDVSMEIAAKSEEETPMSRTPLLEPAAAADDSLQTSFVKEELMAVQVVGEMAEVEELALVEMVPNEVAVETVGPALAVDEEATVQACSKPKKEVARNIGESEIARIGERLGYDATGLL